MKRKRPPVPARPVPQHPLPETPAEIVPEQVMRPERLILARAEKPAKCVVCGEETAPGSTEGLCWVCRRLKLSAWRDADSQISAQE